jgi:hypothetical protein
MQDGEKDGCWGMTMGHDMVWKRKLSDPPCMGEQRREREGYNSLLREERKRQGAIIYCFPQVWVERKKKKLVSYSDPLGKRRQAIGIGREEGGGAADPPQEDKEDGEGSNNSKSRSFIYPLVERQGRKRELLIHGRMNYKDIKPYMSAFLSVDLLTEFAASCLTDFID